MNKTLEEILLCNFSLEELLELNDISEEEVIEVLFSLGMISEPEQIIRDFEVDKDAL